MDGDDDTYMVDGDDDDFGFEYDSSGSEPDVNLENQYYNSKSLKDDNPREAIVQFQRVLELEEEKGEWGFKALKQMIKLLFHLNEFEQMMARYHQLLTYIKTAVTRNHSEKAINSILDFISTSQNMELLQSFYETTLSALQEAKNERLWFKTNLKTAVTRNHSEKAINSILDFISTSQNLELLQSFYKTTLSALQEAKNERLLVQN